MRSRLLVTFRRHPHFYVALFCGLAGVIVAKLLGLPAPWLVGGDILYVISLPS